MNATNSFSVIPLIGSLLVFLLGLFIWVKKPKEWLYVLFFFCNLTIAIWLFGSGALFTATSDAGRLFWGRFIYIGLVFIPIFLYHFGLLYCSVVERQKLLLIFGYLVSFTFLPLSQISNNFVSGLYATDGGVYTAAHLYHHIFLGYFFFYLIAFLVNLYRHYNVSSGPHKTEVKYVLIGYAFLELISPLAFLPAYGMPVYPVAFIPAVAFAIIMAYAIIRFQALNLKIIGAEMVAGFLNILVVGMIFFPNTQSEFLFKLILWVGVFIFSYLLIQMVHAEINQRQEITQLAGSLKNSNQELAKTNTQLKELDKQKTEFLTIAAHQLRTPLSIIKGYVSLLAEGSYGRLSAEVQGILKNMEDSNQWLIFLADEFLNIARLEQGRTKYVFAPKDVRDVIDGVVKELNSKAKPKGLHIVWKYPEDQQVAELDEEKIRYAIFNFMDNAIKYTYEGDIKVESLVDDDGVTVKITDQGIGFDEHDQANFFQKFYRGHNVHTTNVNGTGLGLYVCSKFITGHRGKFWSKSQGLGQGSEFGFWIPKKVPSAVTVSDSSAGGIPQNSL